jgi:magnesium-transporting ATPase (P-type)
VDSALDIAKEAADIILLEKSLLVLDDGVVEGRTTFCNMLKYIRMTASSNFGNVLSVLVASAFLPFLPMLPLQLLVQNLLYDIGRFITQTLVVHMVRTPRLPFIESRAALPLMGMTLAIMAVGLWLPSGPLAGYFKLQALPPAYYGWLVAILLGYCLLTTLMERVYIRRFGWQ